MSLAEPATRPTAVIGPALLQLQNVSVGYGRGAAMVQALDNVSLTVAAGEFVTVVGPSGCGKSTLMHAIAGFVPATHGRVLLNGKPVRQPGADRAVVLQQPTLFPWLTVFGNVELGPRARGMAHAERCRVVDHYLDLVGLSAARDRRPYELSGGMQQRVALARALANDSEILLVDEPFGALDALTRDRMQREIIRIWHETGKTILFITHDVDEAVFCSTAVVVMAAGPGRVIERIALPFSRQFATRARKSREIRTGADYLAMREAVLRIVMPDALDD